MLIKYNKDEKTGKEFVSLYQPTDKIKKSESGKAMVITLASNSKIAVSINGGELKDIEASKLIKAIIE